MEDLIARNRLLKEIREVYEDEFPCASGGFDDFVTNILPNIINSQPVADAITVVRCKDCILSMPAYTKGKMSETEIYCPFLDIRKPNDWHCGDGLRKSKDAETQ